MLTSYLLLAALLVMGSLYACTLSRRTPLTQEVLLERLSDQPHD